MFEINEHENSLYCEVDNNITNISLIDSISTNINNTWNLYYDIYGIVEIPSKTVSLEIGNNNFYISVQNSKNEKKVYSVMIRRLPIYTITFNTNGGTPSLSKQYIQEKQKITQTLTPSKEGYDFIGWDYNINEPVMSSMTLNALYQLTNYKITYNLADGVNNESNPSNYTMETDDIYFLSPEKIGYYFDGWYDSADFLGQKISKIAKGTKNEIILYAKWVKIFDVEDGFCLIDTYDSFQKIGGYGYLTEYKTLSWNYKLTQDITISDNNNRLPIGQGGGIKFSGIFDGQNHKILNLETKNNGSLFGYAKNATIKNIIIENAFIQSDANGSAALVDNITGTLENCLVSAVINIDNEQYTMPKSFAGIANHVNGNVFNCYSRLNIQGNSPNSSSYSIGGIVDRLSGNMENCYSECNIELSNISKYILFGGLVGKIGNNSNSSIKNCVSKLNAKITTSAGIHFGGLVGRDGDGTQDLKLLESSYSYGQIEITSTDSSASIAGLISDYTDSKILQCYTDIQIKFINRSSTYYSSIGNLIIGSISLNPEIINCFYIEENMTIEDNYNNTIIHNSWGSNKELFEILQFVQINWDQSIWNFSNEQQPTLKFFNELT